MSVDSLSPQFISHSLLTSLEFRLENVTPIGHLAEQGSITSPVFPNGSQMAQRCWSQGPPTSCLAYKIKSTFLLSTLIFGY